MSSTALASVVQVAGLTRRLLDNKSDGQITLSPEASNAGSDRQELWRESMAKKYGIKKKQAITAAFPIIHPARRQCRSWQGPFAGCISPVLSWT